MTQASFVSTATFVVIVAVVFGLLLLAVRPTAAEGGPQRWGIAALVLAGWIIVPAVLTRAHLLDRYVPMPAPALVMVGVINAATLVLALSSFGARMAASVPLAVLVGYQGFRLPLEVVLHRVYSEGALPVQMTWSGRNFDVVTGALAIVMAIAVWKGVAGRGAVMLWNVLGLALLVNVVAVAVLSTPTSFRVFTEGPPVLVPSTYPWVWLATLLVPAALFGHVVVFRALGRQRSGVLQPEA